MRRVTIAWIPLLLLCALAARAGEEHQHHEHSATQGPAREEPLEPQIPDVVLIDQHGNPHRFYSDLLKGKLVLMNSIYTSCEGSCPMQTAVLTRVRKMLGDRVGRDVQMISVSVDPVTDTPERLKAFAERLHVGEGWIFLTGPKQDVTLALKAMDLFAPVAEDHTPLLVVGNEPAGIWMKMINLTTPADIVHRLDHVKALGERKRTGG